MQYEIMHYLRVLIVTCCLGLVRGWDDADLEVFDVVEEVNQNFYELLGVSQEATQAEIKSAFKKLTLKLHPDKNDAPDADVQFRNLVSVHNILKDAVKREKYEGVLRDGLPNWRSAVFYYRRARRMGLAEGTALLALILTASQYALAWAAYLEKRYWATAHQPAATKGRASRRAPDPAPLQVEASAPRLRDTLVVQLPRLVCRVPALLLHALREHRDQREQERALLQEERAREERERRAVEEAREAKAEARRRRQARHQALPPPARLPARPPDYVEREGGGAGEEAATGAGAAPVAGGLWTDDDLVELARLMRRLPGGTPRRWDRIAELMHRTVPEVTHMAGKVREDKYRVQGEGLGPQDSGGGGEMEGGEESTPPPPPRKVKTRGGEAGAAGGAGGAGGAGMWSQVQQAALEAALAKFPKGTAADRWERIAKQVPQKTKEECMQRCKYLSDLVRKQRLKEDEERHQPDGDPTDKPNEREDKHIERDDKPIEREDR